MTRHVRYFVCHLPYVLPQAECIGRDRAFWERAKKKTLLVVRVSPCVLSTHSGGSGTLCYWGRSDSRWRRFCRRREQSAHWSLFTPVNSLLVRTMHAQHTRNGSDPKGEVMIVMLVRKDGKIAGARESFGCQSDACAPPKLPKKLGRGYSESVGQLIYLSVPSNMIITWFPFAREPRYWINILCHDEVWFQHQISHYMINHFNIITYVSSQIMIYDWIFVPPPLWL